MTDWNYLASLICVDWGSALCLVIMISVYILSLKKDPIFVMYIFQNWLGLCVVRSLSRGASSEIIWHYGWSCTPNYKPKNICKNEEFLCLKCSNRWQTAEAYRWIQRFYKENRDQWKGKTPFFCNLFTRYCAKVIVQGKCTMTNFD